VSDARPTFSIITVCRNAERSIGTTIESVIAQVDFGGTVEHIVIDGVSTDGTLRVVAGFPHLRVVSGPDAGIYDAMNKGVSLASGQYIGLLNADDWYEPSALATVARAFHEVPGVRRWTAVAPLDVVRPPTGRRRKGAVTMPVHHPACFVTRNVFDRVGGFNLTFPVFADYDWVMRVVADGAEFHYCPTVLTNFRLGGVSTMRFAWRERYRVVRAHGCSVLSAWYTVAHSCAAVLRNRLRRADAWTRA
jgi:glycosyltransferase involved in cell wall biosynthesis